jgi:LmbE family N-acetylglucosaminyl deacetylase
MNNILVVAAHPDDEILGCGGTIARLVAEGNQVFTLILGEGVTSRGGDPCEQRKALDCLREEAVKANAIIGVKDVFFFDFPDNKFDTVALLDIVKVVEKVKVQIAPDIIFTHYNNDLNIDHQFTYRAVITAARPINGETVKEIYSFNTFSSTEWGFPTSFSPDVFFDIKETIQLKIKALEEYKSELRKPPHPRSLESIKLFSQACGAKTGLDFAEAFKTVRVVR